MRSTTTSLKMTTFEPKGYITAANVTEFQQELTCLVTSHESNLLLVDMTRVEFLDSAGLMALASAFRIAQGLGKRLSICSITPSVKIIFELTQLDRVLDIYENRQAFEAFFDQTQDLAA